MPPRIRLVPFTARSDSPESAHDTSIAPRVCAAESALGWNVSSQPARGQRGGRIAATPRSSSSRLMAPMWIRSMMPPESMNTVVGRPMRRYL